MDELHRIDHEKDENFKFGPFLFVNGFVIYELIGWYIWFLARQVKFNDKRMTKTLISTDLRNSTRLHEILRSAN